MFGKIEMKYVQKKMMQMSAIQTCQLISGRLESAQLEEISFFTILLKPRSIININTLYGMSWKIADLFVRDHTNNSSKDNLQSICSQALSKSRVYELSSISNDFCIFSFGSGSRIFDRCEFEN